MLSLLLVAAASLGIDAAPFSSDDRQSYEAALAQVGRDPDAHVRLALWCEAHGLNAERLKHLSLAVLNAPGHPLARGLLGLVSFQGRWQRPEAVQAALRADAARKILMADYQEKRDKVHETADAHYKLALWCEEHGLKSEATAHLWSAVRLDPAREAAWKRLGYKKQRDGRWMTEPQVAKEKEDAVLLKRAEQHWKPLLEKWRSWLSDKDAAKRAEAERLLAEVRDVQAVTSVWAVFATGEEPGRKRAVQLLGQIDAVDASRGLAYLAVFSNSAEVRRLATEALRRRDPREFAGAVIALLRDPIKYEVRQIDGPGSTGTIFIEGQRSNVQRRYLTPSSPFVVTPNGIAFRVRYSFGNGQETLTSWRDRMTGVWTTDADGLPMLINTGVAGMSGYIAPNGSYVLAGRAGLPLPSLPRVQGDPALAAEIVHDPQHAASIVAAHAGHAREMKSGSIGLPAWSPDVRYPSLANAVQVGQAVLATQKAAANAQQQLADDVAALDRYNAEINTANSCVAQVLIGATGVDLGTDSKSWQRWLTDQFGFPQRVSDQQQKPTIVQEITQDLPPLAGFTNDQGSYTLRVRYSCFGAGTMVHTVAGLRRIETIRVGDEVLTQNCKTGALAYQPVLLVFHNPPAPTFRVEFAGESIVSSQSHRFWRTGQGWVMARDLKPGDRLRTLGSVMRVESVDTDTVQPVFNLDVAEDADFFVGKSGILVHDNTLPDLRQTPFDAESGLAAAVSR